MQTLRKAKEEIEAKWGEDLTRLVLSWDGTDVLVLEKWGSVRSAAVHPGQGVLHLIAIPVDEWRLEAERQQQTVNLTHLRKLAEKRAERPDIVVTEILRGIRGAPAAGN